MTELSAMFGSDFERTLLDAGGVSVNWIEECTAVSTGDDTCRLSCDRVQHIFFDSACTVAARVLMKRRPQECQLLDTQSAYSCSSTSTGTWSAATLRGPTAASSARASPRPALCTRPLSGVRCAALLPTSASTMFCRAPGACPSPLQLLHVFSCVRRLHSFETLRSIAGLLQHVPISSA